VIAMNREQRIRQRAYEIWESEGKPHGRDDEHWRRAEADIEKEGAHAAGTMPGELSREERYSAEGQGQHAVQPVTSRPLTHGAQDLTKQPAPAKKKSRAARPGSPGGSQRS
jgi:hypothetical protein